MFEDGSDCIIPEGQNVFHTKSSPLTAVFIDEGPRSIGHSYGQVYPAVSPVLTLDAHLLPRRKFAEIMHANVMLAGQKEALMAINLKVSARLSLQSFTCILAKEKVSH